MSNTTFIQYMNKIYTFKEIDDFSIEYKWIVVKNNSRDNIVALTKMYKNYKELGCIYPDRIMKEFDSLIKY